MLEGKLCYSLDLSLINVDKTQVGMSNGLLLLLDSAANEKVVGRETEEDGRIKTINLDPLVADDNSVKIYLNTLGRNTDYRAGSYALSGIKKMTGTSSFIGLEDNIKNCQIETFEDCNTKRYMEAVQEKCDCTPWALSRVSTGKVKHIDISCFQPYQT